MQTKKWLTVILSASSISVMVFSFQNCSGTYKLFMPFRSQAAEVFPNVQVLKGTEFQGAGLIPLTLEKFKKMHKENGVRRIKHVKLNALGVQRINEERLKKGLNKIELNDLYPMGSETEVDPNDDYDFTSTASTNSAVESEAEKNKGDALSDAMPSFVDNSTLPAFPGIGAQGNIGSCMAWTSGYYQNTHNNGLAMGITTNTPDNSKKCSPKFVFNLINGGSNQGSSLDDAFLLLQKHGCVSWAHFPYDANYLEWPSNPVHWKEALSYRSQPVQFIFNIDQDASLNLAKQILNDGYLLSFATYIGSWQYTVTKADPSQSSNPRAGQQVAYWMNGNAVGHGMVIVGYDDNIWTDINNNNRVDPGELGAFKAANSYGTSYANNGFIWIAYDALKAVSAVPGGPSAGRLPIFFGNHVIHMPVKSAGGIAYKPTHTATFTLDSAARNQLNVSFTSVQNGITKFLNLGALVNQGGPYAFNGTRSSVRSTFVVDLTDLNLSDNQNNQVTLNVNDNTNGAAVGLYSYTLNNVNQFYDVPSTINSPIYADARTINATLNYPSAVINRQPVISFRASATSGQAPISIYFEGSGSFDPEGRSLTYFWDFSNGQTSTLANPTTTFTNAGSYDVSLTVTDDKGAQTTSHAIITITPSNNLSPVVYLYADKTSGPAPLTINFKGSDSYDPERKAITFLWNFGNGQTSTLANPRITYTNAGSYEVYLTVTDDRGAQTTNHATITAMAGKPVPPVNPVDKIKPTVTLISPVNNGRYPLNSDVLMQSSSNDNVGVVRVEYYINKKKVCTSLAVPFRCTAKMPRAALAKPAQAKAYDARGNVGVSQVVKIKN